MIDAESLNRSGFDPLRYWDAAGVSIVVRARHRFMGQQDVELLE